VTERAASGPEGPAARRTVPAALAAGVIGALAATVLVDVAAVAVSGHAAIWPYRAMAGDLRRTSWSALWVRAAAAAAVAVGLALIVVAVRRPHDEVELGPAGPARRVVTTRRSLRRALVRTASSVDGVGRVSVTLHRDRAEAEVRTPLRDARALEAEVTAALEARLAVLQPGQPLRVAVRVRTAAAPPGRVPA
jgi:hypothetical protein